MPLYDITSKFQNYTYNDNKTISQALVDLNNTDQLDVDDLQIQEYLLHEILTLFKKALLNKFSADLLFQKNYWSWGFVTLYYSNFYLSQSLNRLKGDFIVRYGRGMKNIQLNTNDNKYKLINANSSDNHKKELEKLRENYAFLLSDITYKTAIPDDYQVRPFFNESKVRNDINYTLKYYQEFDRNFTCGIAINECQESYKSNTFSHDEFKFLEISDSRFKLIYHLLNNIKGDNANFESKFNILSDKLSKQLMYKNHKEYLKYIESIFKQHTFHIPSERIHTQFKGYK